jgi:ribose transport system permease protein
MISRLRTIKIDPAYYGFIAAIVLWGLTVTISGGRGAYETMSVALAFAIFAVTVGTGQMFVISSGPGNIDLSSPAVMTLAAYLSMNAMGGNGWLLPLGLVIVVLVGAAAGAFNYGLIRALSIPPIIATLATSFILMSLAMNAGGESTVKPPAALAGFTAWRVFGIQVLLLLAVASTIIIQIVISRTAFGRRLMAVGQNERAAMLAGVPVGRVRLLAYVISGALAGLAGFLLAGFTGGAALNMGDSYLMQSVAVAVLGGTSVAGGRANAVGIWGAALFLSLLTTLLNTSGVAIGWQFILSGVVIMLVVLLVAERR